MDRASSSASSRTDLAVFGHDGKHQLGQHQGLGFPGNGRLEPALLHLASDG
jgi:hypothetical protein